MEAALMDLQMSSSAQSAAEHTGLWSNPLQLSIVIPDASDGDCSASEQSSCSSTPKASQGPLSSRGSSSARRVLHCSQSGDYSDVARWLDRQICMRECARAQLPAGLNGSPVAPAAPAVAATLAAADHARPWKALADLQLSGPEAADDVFPEAQARLLGGGGGLPPPAFHLLGLM